MARLRTVERKTGTAYEVHRRQGATKKQRTFTAKRTAERFAMKVETELAEGDSTEPLVKKAKTVAQVIEASMAASKPELKPRTFHSYELLYANRILPTFGSRRVSTVTRADVQTWVTALAGEGLFTTTVHHHYVALKKAFRYAQHDRLISYNPCDGIKMPKNHDAEQFQSVFLNATQVESVARELAPFAPYYLLVRFAAYTGLRAGEMAGLRVRDLDLVVGHVSVRQTAQRIGGEWVYGTPKSRRSVRDVPLMHSGLIAELRRYKMQHPNSGNPDALFWPGRHVGSNRLDYSRVIDMGSFRRNYLQTVLTNAELPPMRFHDLRHTAASLWLAAGFKPYEVSRWRGHANVSTTDGIYAHLYPNDYSKHVARFDAFVALH